MMTEAKKKTTPRRGRPRKQKSPENNHASMKLDMSMFEGQRFEMRIVEFKIMPARDLLDHTGNWRMHPVFQRESLQGGLEEIGITDIIKAYYSQRSGGNLVIVDGHLRKSMDPNQLWVVAILNLNDDEADKQLALHDSIGEMALVDAEKHDDLLAKAKFQNERLRQAAERIRAGVRDQANIAKRLREERNQPKADTPPSLSEKLSKTKNKGAKVVVSLPDGLDVFERALKETTLPNRSDALIEIATFYLNHHHEDKIT